jgi:hypothetical protein
MVSFLGESLDYHNRRWRRGPEEGEGYYLEDYVGQPDPQPVNAMSAMGTALWLSWKASGNEEHRERALALARFLKARLTLDEEGFYRWPYMVLPHSRFMPQGVPMDDISHGASMLRLAALLASDGEVFSEEDMRAFGRIVVKGFGRLGKGVLLPRIDGSTEGSVAQVRRAAVWLAASPYLPDVYPLIAEHYVAYRVIPEPLDLSLLILYAPQHPQGGR